MGLNNTVWANIRRILRSVHILQTAEYNSSSDPTKWKYVYGFSDCES